MEDAAALRAILARVADLESEAKAILATHEGSTERIITLEASYAKLDQLSLAQDELFRESLRAVRGNLLRAAHVLAWAGFVDFLHNLLVPTHQAALKAALPKWIIASPEDLREHADYQVIEAGKTIGVYNIKVMRALHAHLDRRNDCAHPSEYFPDLNRTLGYISELIDRIERLTA